MTRRTAIGAPDYRALLELTGELGELASDPGLAALHLTSRLMAHLGADGAGFAEVDDFNPGAPSALLRPLAVGLGSETERLAVNRAPAVACSADPGVAGLKRRFAASGQGALTALRSDLAPAHDYARSANIAEIRTAAHVTDTLYAVALVGRPTHVAGLALWRTDSRRPFSPVERDALALFQRAVAGLYRRLGEPHRFAESLAGLSPRRRTVVLALLDGQSEKEVAHALQLSQHTVHEHVRALYVHFGVRSRPELMARFVR
jgi:DNA-binding CsgD family transcriptional regulator